ncbi:hypothetical protein TRFO_28332 [Tritrichomonas foetus]|uniref:Uncharacterized protein n=1 Tax=Tritrichomonas foetus TaxID=1144522 RepID=A0A1J4JYI3_9EUKA|nr:hypothetical protein TRFO_28332 [Tritrichomonas foetus]|eukprot:OHT04223.1 hypothetical protein TRFO_28332 [Tritrichomonas foetus]
MSKKAKQGEIVHGMPSGKHEPMNDVLQGWDKRIEETKRHNAEVRKQHTHKGTVKMVHKSAKDEVLPSDLDPNFVYGMSTHDIDVRNDPFLRSNAIIEQRVAQQDRELKREQARLEANQGSPSKRVDPRRPTAASLGHTKKPEPEPGLKDTFKMKRFTNLEHGKIDTGLRKNTKPKA